MNKRHMRTQEASELYCVECGTKNIIYRPKGCKRAKGHIKHLYCYRCQMTTAHQEHLRIGDEK